MSISDPTATTTGTHASDAHLDRFTHEQYLVRRKVLKIFGGAFHIYDDAENVVLYCKMKAFKLKEDLRIYTSDDMQTEVLTIQARNVIDFSAGYDVVDSVQGTKVGTLRRKGMKSILRDEWLILDENEQEIATIREDSMLKALARRFVELVALFLPQKYHVESNGSTICTMQQNMNPFVYKLEVDFSLDQHAQLDRRLGLAAAILLAAIEGKQN